MLSTSERESRKKQQNLGRAKKLKETIKVFFTLDDIPAWNNVLPHVED
jgi:hypothetical protein